MRWRKERQGNATVERSLAAEARRLGEELVIMGNRLDVFLFRLQHEVDRLQDQPPEDTGGQRK